MEPIVIIPATDFQKKQYELFNQNQIQIIKREVDSQLDDFYSKLSPSQQKENDSYFMDLLEENRNRYYPVLSEKQLEAIPSKIEIDGDYTLSNSDKELLLLEGIVTIASDTYNVEKDFVLNNNNQISIFDDFSQAIENRNSPLDVKNVTFKNKPNIIEFNKDLTNKYNFKTLIIMENNPNELDVKGVSRPLQVNDPVLYVQDNIHHYTGKIDKFNEDGSTSIKVYNSKEVKDLVVAQEDFNKMQPLFILDKDQKMVYTKFTYEEVTKALNSSEDVKTNFEKGKTPIMALMLGNKSDVIPFDKKIDDKMAPVEGRLEVKRNSNGQPVLSSDIKFKELNLERPIYGKTFDAAQIDKLKTTGELGLVEGFKSKEGKEFNLWVSLDKELNKVVTKRENDVYIGQIFGVNTTEEQKAQLKSGQGVVLPLKNGNEYYFAVSAATKSANGLKSFTADKAKEFGLIPKQEEEKKNTKSKGMKV